MKNQSNTRIKSSKNSKRSFDAAQLNRLTASWNSLIRSVNDDLKYELPTLRARSNELAQNEPLYKKYLNLVEENIVGANGFQLQSKAFDEKGVDNEANKAIEQHFQNWATQCDVRRKLTLPEMERMAARSVARDGEILIRHIYDDSNAYGYRIQLISAERLANINIEPSPGNNQVIAGVEIDSYGAPIAYFIYRGKCISGAPTDRILAAEISHIFVPEYPEQVRGIPWGHAVMTRMHVLKKYVEFALMASAIGASKMGFFTSKEESDSPLAENEDENGELYTSAVGGEFGILPPGYGFESFNPDYPHAMFDIFTKAINRWIASGLGVSYNLLCNDLQGVSYSSIRSSVLEERNHWEALQNTFISQLMEPIYKNWLTSALLKNSITDVKGRILPASKISKFTHHVFLGRRWQWVDPLRDSNAKVLLLKNKLQSPYNIASEIGLDLDNILDDHARFKQECEARGLNPDNALDEISQRILDEDEKNNSENF